MTDATDALPTVGAARAELRRELGLAEAVSVGIGGTVGGGIFVLVGVAAGLAGPAALIAFVAAFCAALLIALPYAELACRLPLAGGGYAYVRQILGPLPGFLMGWGYWGAYLLISGYVTLGFGGYLHSVSGIRPEVGAIALVATVTGVNAAGVKLSGRAQTVAVGTAVAGLLCFVVWGTPSTNLGLLEPFAPAGASAVFAAALVAFLSFGGFDMVAAAGEEVRDPERTLPRALLITLASVLALYLTVTVVALATLPAADLGASPAPLADAAATFGGEAGRRLIVFVALLTTAATANAILVVTSRITFAMGRDGLLPRVLGRVGLRTAAPWASVWVNGALLALVAATGSVRFVTSAGGFLYVLHFMPPLVALVVLRRRGAARPAFSTPAPRVVVPLAFAASGGLLVAAGTTGWSVGTLWLAGGLLAHWLSGVRSRSRSRGETDEPRLSMGSSAVDGGADARRWSVPVSSPHEAERGGSNGHARTGRNVRDGR